MNVNNDLTNTFGFFGSGGLKPSAHRPHEFLSSVKLGGITQIFNKIGWLSAYNYESEEGHNTFFYGSVVFRRIDGTMSAFLDSTFSNYGINLPYDSADATQVYNIYNTDSSFFSVPLDSNLKLEYVTPNISLGCLYADTSLYSYRPILSSVTGVYSKAVNIFLLDCFDGTFMNETDYNTMGDRDLRIQLFGFSPIMTEVL